MIKVVLQFFGEFVVGLGAICQHAQTARQLPPERHVLNPQLSIAGQSPIRGESSPQSRFRAVFFQTASACRTLRGASSQFAATRSRAIPSAQASAAPLTATRGSP